MVQIARIRCAALAMLLGAIALPATAKDSPSPGLALESCFGLDSNRVDLGELLAIAAGP